MAKINVSVSSSSSKPNVTVSKGPVGPQGEQGVQGESGPSGPAGVVPSLESIPNVHIPSLENGGYIDNPSDGGHIQNALTFDPQNNRWTTVNAAMGSVPTSGNKSAAPPTGNSWTDPILTVDFNESTSVASTKLALNNSNYIPSDVNLYVNGPSRFNGSVQIASGGSTVYTLPSADGTANQILKTDGSGAVSFTGDYLTKSTADVITATKRFNVQQDFVGGVNITNGASINGYTLPTSDGTAGQFLKTDGSGNISFAAASSLALGTTSTTALAGDTTTISTTQASEIAANTLKVGITTTQASEITANTAKTDTNISNADLTLDDSRTVDMSGNDFIINPNGGAFEINDSSGLPGAAEIAIGQGNVEIAGTQVSINGIDYPAVDGSAGQFLKTDGSGNLSFSNVAQSIDGLTDVDTTTAAPADGQALVWNNTNSEWKPGSVGIDGLVTTLDGDDIRSWRPGLGEFGVDTSAADDGSLNLSLGEGHPRDLYFKPDGTKCYIVGNGVDDIHEVPLATAWDLQSATVANIVDVNLAGSLSVGGGGHEGQLCGIHIADDANDSSTYGKKFFIVGSNRDEIQEYTATTAWDASTISTAATDKLYIGSQDGNPSALRFTPDGETLYVLDGDNDASPRCRAWELSTAWDLSTATYNSSRDVNFPTIDRNARGLDFNSDGSVVYITTTSNNIHQYNLSTAYDISTLSYVRSLNTSTFRVFTHYPSNNHTNETYGSLEGIYFAKSDSNKHAFLLYNNGDEIIRLERTGLIQSNDTIFRGVVDAAALNVSGTCLLGSTKFLGGVVMGSPYINGAMNWNGFNSGPIKGATSGHDALTCGSNVKSIGFADSTSQNPDSHNLNNTVTGTWIHRPASPQADSYNIMLPASSGTIRLDTDKSYLNSFITEATAKVTGATEDIEYYYTARADGQGLHKRALGVLPASGQTLTRTSYYSNKAFADPDTSSDWTQGTVYSSTSLESAISQSNDAFLNVQSTGTPPLSTKIVTAGYLGSSGLLVGDSNGFSGTSVAYSLRLVNNLYGGAAIRVVNDSGVEADIGFASNLELDTTALLTHCGSGDGYLVKWYDQAQGGSTGDGNDATWESSTSYSSRKPQIVSAGSVITDNGKPCLETIDAGMVMDEEFSASNEYDLFFVAQKTLNNNNHGMIWGTQTGNDCRVWLHDYRLYLQVSGGQNNEDGYGDGGANTRWYEMGQLILNVRRDGSDINTAQRNDVVGDHNYTKSGDMRTDRILNAWNNQQYSFAGNVQEIIMLDGDKSSERAAILSNLNTYYSVY